jgi:hypothetical protein
MSQTQSVRGLVPLLDKIDLPRKLDSAIRKADKLEKAHIQATIAANKARKFEHASKMGKTDTDPSDAANETAKAIRATDKIGTQRREAVRALETVIQDCSKQVMDHCSTVFSEEATLALDGVEAAQHGIDRAGAHSAVFSWLFNAHTQGLTPRLNGPGASNLPKFNRQKLAVELMKWSPSETVRKHEQREREAAEADTPEARLARRALGHGYRYGPPEHTTIVDNGVAK